MSIDPNTPCPLLIEHMNESRDYRENQTGSVREIFQRLNKVEQDNVEQTIMLRAIMETMRTLSDKTLPVYNTYQLGKGVVWFICGIGSVILVLAAALEMFDKFRIYWGKQ